jgi:uncharacterized protein
MGSRSMWETVAQSLCLVLIFEGMAPFISPQGWRRMMMTLASVKDEHLRIYGLASMLLGVALLYLL